MPMPYLAVPVFKEGWKDSPNPSMEPGPLGTEMALGPTALLSAARQLELPKQMKTKKAKKHHGQRQNNSGGCAKDMALAVGAFVGWGRIIISMPTRERTRQSGGLDLSGNLNRKFLAHGATDPCYVGLGASAGVDDSIHLGSTLLDEPIPIPIARLDVLLSSHVSPWDFLQLMRLFGVVQNFLCFIRHATAGRCRRCSRYGLCVRRMDSRCCNFLSCLGDCFFTCNYGFLP